MVDLIYNHYSKPQSGGSESRYPVYEGIGGGASLSRFGGLLPTIATLVLKRIPSLVKDIRKEFTKDSGNYQYSHDHGTPITATLPKEFFKKITSTRQSGGRSRRKYVKKGKKKVNGNKRSKIRKRRRKSKATNSRNHRRRRRRSRNINRKVVDFLS